MNEFKSLNLSLEVNADHSARLLFSERPEILRMCHNDEDIAAEVIGRIEEDISREGKINYKNFIEDTALRIQLYKNKLAEILRERHRRVKTIGGNALEYSLNHPLAGDEQNDKTIFDAPINIEEYVKQMQSSLSTRAVQRGLTDQSGKNISIVIARKLEGKTLREIGEELGVSESNVSHMIKKFRKTFPQYEGFWKFVMNERDSSYKNGEVIAKENVALYKERISRVLSDLEDVSEPSKFEQGLIILGNWYLSDTGTRDDLNRQLSKIHISPSLRSFRRLYALFEE